MHKHFCKFLVAVIGAAVPIAPFAATSQEPDALDVEWQGKKLCENLHEDDQIRILRCVFPPGAKHLRHQHPANFAYALSGGKFDVQSPTGRTAFEPVADAAMLSARVPWHEVTNIGDTTVRYIVVEMKYRTP